MKLLNLLAPKKSLFLGLTSLRYGNFRKCWIGLVEQLNQLTKQVNKNQSRALQLYN